ncbi:MAG TPA: Ppx/GppA phosphatase family protein [Streptosporangiaceae bacterium]|jgi:exopolyphosphatase/guanosine-5'-triphosphate,3'-diphosphate pyrophosphatase
MKRVAAVDCGTNSIRLLVAELDPHTGESRDLSRRMEIVRLGQGVDRTGRLNPDALDRTLEALRDYKKIVDDLGARSVRMVATSATRDAENRDAFVEGVHAILGVDPEVITGDEEARLSFLGATRELAGAGDAVRPYLVVDIGGGSTEFVIGGTDVTAGRSVNIGCVRLTERHLHDDPPTPAQIEAATADIDAAIDEAAQAVPLLEAGSLLGLAGTVTTLAGIDLDLPAYDPERIHHSRISAARVHEISGKLLAMTHAERAAIPVMHPGRVDVIGAGSLILDRIVARVGLDDVLVSEHDILDGMAWSLV